MSLRSIPAGLLQDDVIRKRFLLLQVHFATTRGLCLPTGAQGANETFHGVASSLS